MLKLFRRKSTSPSTTPPAGWTRRLEFKWLGVTCIGWARNGQNLAMASDDVGILILEARGGKGLRTLRAAAQHEHEPRNLAVTWSSSDQFLASRGNYRGIRVWDVRTAKLMRTIGLDLGADEHVHDIAWSPDESSLAAVTEEGQLRIWDVQTGEVLRSLNADHLTLKSGGLRQVCWSPDGSQIAACGMGDTILAWSVRDWEPIANLRISGDRVRSIAWSDDNRLLACGTDSGRIVLSDVRGQMTLHVLEGNTDGVQAIGFVPSVVGKLLASVSDDGRVKLWNAESWDALTTFRIGAGTQTLFSEFCLASPTIASYSNGSLTVWDVDIRMLLNYARSSDKVTYRSAKVVLLGDSGVGKSGLSLVLTGQGFKATESTHNRHVLPLETIDSQLPDNRLERRETWLWDLAGQPGYRLTHQLHLNEVTVALIVFDARSDTDSFAGVHYWERALRQAQRLQSALHGPGQYPVKKFLVAARVDRGAIAVGSERIKSVVADFGFDGYFQTSAKELVGIADLAAAIRSNINWAALPQVTSSKLFDRIKAFLITQRFAGLILTTADDLYQLLLQSDPTLSDDDELAAQFITCVSLVESRGLIRRFSFGNFILLQPEILDAYASALVNAVILEPNEMGSILEDRVWSGDFFVPHDARIRDEKYQRALIIAMIEDLLRREVVLRDGAYLVFPSESRREKVDLPEPDSRTVILSFEGPIQNIYSTLVVRLAHGGVFTKKELWQNGAAFSAASGGTYSLYLRNRGEGQGELLLFFDKDAGQETSTLFSGYVMAHLKRSAIPESVKRRQVFGCPHCHVHLSDVLVFKRRELGFDWLQCPVCEEKVPLDRYEETARLSSSSPAIDEMDSSADSRRDREAAHSIVQGKRASGHFDVFLCHNGDDKPEVRAIADTLESYGILPWLDERELRPGMPWQSELERQIERIQAAAVFVGPSGIGPWEQQELAAYLRRFVHSGIPVIPVILKTCKKHPRLPTFLAGMTWVDFRNDHPDPVQRLIWGITGRNYQER